MILYVDASAFVKLVLDEPGAAETRVWFAGAQQAVTSVITYPEATSAICRNDREAGPEDTRLQVWLTARDAYWRRCLHMPVAEQAAGRLALTHGLRGMDAVQLASAATLRARIRADSPSADFHFLAYDRQLLAAAEREGFATLGAQLE